MIRQLIVGVGEVGVGEVDVDGQPAQLLGEDGFGFCEVREVAPAQPACSAAARSTSTGVTTSDGSSSGRTS